LENRDATVARLFVIELVDSVFVTTPPLIVLAGKLRLRPTGEGEAAVKGIGV